MDAIVSVTRDWGIGRDGGLLVRNKADMRRFKELTMGGSVIMGRKTFESLPGGPLTGRNNIVLTRARDLASSEDIEVARSIDEALALADAYGERAWLIGGASLYRQFIDRCSMAYVTFHDIVLDADTYFPDLDGDDAWSCIGITETDFTERGIPFHFALYEHL
ncbi:dihydrofolate reductase [Coriobacteriales bacterium OH1046]|nr:dihydrofolate reductase [Coriobacteriales bacterium OH1046]